MFVTETPIKGVYTIELDRITDNRGFFARSWCIKEFEAHHLNPKVVQNNVVFSSQKGTIRGIHYQLAPGAEVKTVRCTSGAIFDIAVDLRPESPTHKQWFGVELTADNHKLLYVPEGCGHAYQSLTDNTELTYQTSELYIPAIARGVRYDDAAFAISWPLPVTSISDQDRTWSDYLQ
jgi:dTDP-4-dehydrorhamnose 3,5-epimerase